MRPIRSKPGAAWIVCVLSLVAAAAGCVGPPKGVEAVQPFDAERYLGTWYEIARLDHKFERGLTDVTATYARADDGTIRVTNRGFDARSGMWKTVEGVGKPAGDADVGSLKVKVGAPFFTGYHVIALDQEGYRYAMVSGPSRDYLWILARDPSLPDDVKTRLVAEAKSKGFATDQLIYVTHDRQASGG